MVIVINSIDPFRHQGLIAFLSHLLRSSCMCPPLPWLAGCSQTRGCSFALIPSNSHSLLLVLSPHLERRFAPASHVHRFIRPCRALAPHSRLTCFFFFLGPPILDTLRVARFSHLHFFTSGGFKGFIYLILFSSSSISAEGGTPDPSYSTSGELLASPLLLPTVVCYLFGLLLNFCYNPFYNLHQYYYRRTFGHKFDEARTAMALDRFNIIFRTLVTTGPSVTRRNCVVHVARGFPPARFH